MQLTDLHIREPGRLAYRRVDTSRYFRAMVDSVLALKQRPDAVVITGDLTDFGRPVEYASLREQIAPLEAAGLPVYLMPGNHDDRAELRRAFPAHRYLGGGGSAVFMQFAVDIGPLRLLALDTCVPMQSAGALDAERLAWLAAQLDASTDQPGRDRHAPPAVPDADRPHGQDRTARKAGPSSRRSSRSTATSSA